MRIVPSSPAGPRIPVNGSWNPSMTTLSAVLSPLFDVQDFAPHGMCLAWQPGVLWLHVASDVLTGLAYYSIPIVLVVLVWKRRDLGFGWVAALFAAFILACGTTHMMGVWTLWNPDYYAQGVIKAITAVVSVATAIVLWPLLPRMLATPTPAQLTLVNTALEAEIGEKEAVASRLRDSERRYASVFDNVAEALFTFTVDRDGLFRFDMINPTAAQALDVRRDAVIGLRLDEAMPAETAQLLHERFTATCASGTPREFEQTAEMPGGRTAWDIVVVPLRDADGHVGKLLVTARDISARKRLEEEVLQASKLATIGTMSAGIAHEMSQPLNAISLWATMGRRRIGSGDASATETVTQALTVIEEQALRMRKIIDHMRAYSRRDDGETAPFDAAEAVRHAIVMMEQDLMSREITLTVDITDDAAAVVDGRAVQFEQVIVNLLANARDAVSGRREAEPDAPRHIALHLRNQDDAVEVVVKDTGGGIPRSVSGRLFEPFFTTKPAGTGTGLGLAICQRIIHSMGGTITADTVDKGQPTAGARLRISVPLHRPPSPEES